MAKREVRHPDKAVATGAYSAGVLCDGWLYVSGQGPLDLKTGKVVGATIEEQTAVTLRNIEKILRAGGCTKADVVKCACHLADIRDFPRFNKAYAEFFGAGVLPARTTVQSGMSGILVEIDAVARVPSLPRRRPGEPGAKP